MKCPYLKITEYQHGVGCERRIPDTDMIEIVNYDVRCNSLDAEIVIEGFADCVGADCIAWDDTESKPCRLIWQ